jgi:hypothetical protein
VSSSIQIDPSAIPAGLGELQPLRFPAHRYMQGGRVTYNAPLSLVSLTELVERPDPDKPLPGNRVVVQSRAKAFADYLGVSSWVSPGLTLRVLPGEVAFEDHWSTDTLQWGELSISRSVTTTILDGQHRSLGMFIRFEDLKERIEKQKNSLITAKNNGNMDTVPELQRRLRKLQDELAELARQYVNVEIVEATQEQATQMFVDIANNAKGVNPDFTAILDQRSVVNRIAAVLIDDHPLLQNRVETGQGRSFRGGTNPNLLGAKGVADIVRAVHVGVSGRVGKVLESKLALNEADATARVRTFLDVLVASFEELRAVMDSTLPPQELRQKSMLGSLTMLRVLAGIYHELTMGEGDHDVMPRSEVQDFFGKLEPLLREIPVQANSLWFATGAFQLESTAPLARGVDIATLTKTLVEWARHGIPESRPAEGDSAIVTDETD